MQGELLELQRWYAAQCDGDWEHDSGIQITTLDTPGWSVEINLQGTSIEARRFDPIEIHASDTDWIVCRLTDGKFHGVGDPLKLERILRTFLDWANGAT